MIKTFDEYAKDTPNTKVLYVITDDDVFSELALLVGQKKMPKVVDYLMKERLPEIQKGLQAGLGECWADILKVAILQVVEELPIWKEVLDD